MKNLLLLMFVLTCCTKRNNPAPSFSFANTSWSNQADTRDSLRFSNDSLTFIIPTYLPITIQYKKLTNDTIIFPASGIKHILKVYNQKTLYYIEPSFSDTSIFVRN